VRWIGFLWKINLCLLPWALLYSLAPWYLDGRVINWTIVMWVGIELVMIGYMFEKTNLLQGFGVLAAVALFTIAVTVHPTNSRLSFALGLVGITVLLMHITIRFRAHLWSFGFALLPLVPIISLTSSDSFYIFQGGLWTRYGDYGPDFLLVLGTLVIMIVAPLVIWLDLKRTGEVDDDEVREEVQEEDLPDEDRVGGVRVFSVA